MAVDFNNKNSTCNREVHEVSYKCPEAVAVQFVLESVFVTKTKQNMFLTRSTWMHVAAGDEEDAEVLF